MGEQLQETFGKQGEINPLMCTDWYIWYISASFWNIIFIGAVNILNKILVKKIYDYNQFSIWVCHSDDFQWLIMKCPCIPNTTVGTAPPTPCKLKP